MKKQLERKRESIHEITVKKREWYINVSTASPCTVRFCTVWNLD